MLKNENFEPVTILNMKKVDASHNFVRGSILAKDPGIYRFEFDNTSSWFKNKEIKYLIHILEPDYNVDSYLPINTAAAHRPMPMQRNLKNKSNSAESLDDDGGNDN